MAESIVIYNYHAETGEYLGTGIALRSPLDREGIYLIPANATEIAPPSLQTEQAAVFESGSWSIVPDHRGQTWFDAATGKEAIVEVLGVPNGLIRELTQELQAKVQADALDAAWENVRAERDRRIRATDMCMLPDYQFKKAVESGMTRDAAYQAVLAYRQALRDLPNNPNTDPMNPDWPEEPILD